MPRRSRINTRALRRRIRDGKLQAFKLELTHHPAQRALDGHFDMPVTDKLSIGSRPRFSAFAALVNRLRDITIDRAIVSDQCSLASWWTDRRLVPRDAGRDYSDECCLSHAFPLPNFRNRLQVLVLVKRCSPHTPEKWPSLVVWTWSRHGRKLASTRWGERRRFWGMS